MIKRGIIFLALVILLTIIVNATSGDECSYDYQCNAGEYCDELAFSCISIQGAGNSGGSSGDICEYNSDCARYHECRSGSCFELGQEGDICSNNNECLRYHICRGGSCFELRNLGESCSSDNECSTGLCKNSRCEFKQAIGSRCSRNIECSSNRCSSNTCIIDCNSDSNCRNNQFCSNYRCSSDLGSNQECSRNAQCTSNSCINFRCSGSCSSPSRNGRANYGCVNFYCDVHGDCSEGNFCDNNICTALSGNRCVLNNDCSNGNSCVRGYCVLDSCNSNNDCTEGMICSDNRCVNQGSRVCNNYAPPRGPINCPEGQSCASNRCVTGCSSDLNCNIAGSTDICVGGGCLSFCNNGISPEMIQLISGSGEYRTSDLSVINPYSYGAVTGEIINLRYDSVFVEGFSADLSSSLWYSKEFIFNGRSYNVFVDNNVIYLLFDDFTYRSSFLAETSELGVFSGSINIREGRLSLSFNTESRTLDVSLNDLPPADFELDPIIVYSYEDSGTTVLVFVDDCDVSLDCYNNANCLNGDLCIRNTCINENEDNGNNRGLGGIDWGFFNLNPQNNFFIDPNNFRNGFVLGCNSNNDCAPNEICDSGVCVVETQGNDEDSEGNDNGAGGGSGGGGSSSSSRCNSDIDCFSYQLCSDNSCVNKDSISRCNSLGGISCSSSESCLVGSGELLDNVLCCTGENNGCVSVGYSSDLASRAVVVRGDCIDSDNDGTGLRETKICYPNSKSCDSSNLIPAADLNLDSNPYFEECHKPSADELKNSSVPWKLIIASSIGGIVILIIIGSIFYLRFNKTKKRK